jgi:Novel STAND NTPase 1
MDLKRLTEWITTAEGLGKAVIALVGVPAAMWLAFTKAFEPLVALGLPAWVSSGATILIIAAFGFLLWRSFRRFAQASRLEQPDSFTLHPTGPASLIGRTDDLARLLNSVKRNRLVLLDGDSGCGKSALVSAGLVPQLNQPDGWLTLVVRDWGDDWVHGPLSATLDAVWHVVSQADRDRLDWRSSPDLAADTAALATDLGARLKAVSDVLQRRVLLVADQFDDYQAQHRARFLDEEGSWLAPTALASVNDFWRVVRAALCEGRLHLLVVTRADAASGLACVRFLGEDQTATRTLPRVEAEYLHPLLAGIAPDDAQPPVIRNPAEGWHQLRDRLEQDLKSEGAILMQQVRTVLLGLRQLPLLTPNRYRVAGGLRGVESLVVSRALRRAADAVGGGEIGLRAARALLARLILPGGPNQQPKAQRASIVSLGDIVGDRSRAQAILSALQSDEVVRPAESIDSANAWQLDHDYLARAVLWEARQAERWASALREGKARYDEAVGDWRRRWAALLPFFMLIRVCWERARKRVTFGEAAGFVRLSALRHALFLLLVVSFGIAAFTLNEDRLLTSDAIRLVERFGGSNERDAVLEVWRAAEPLRNRVYKLVIESDDRLERATRSRWPLAHAGFEPARIREAATALRARLARERDRLKVSSLTQAYAVVARRLNDPVDLKAEATALRARLEQEKDSSIASSLAQAYAVVARRVNDPADLKAEATALSTRLEQEKDGFLASSLAQAYAAVAGRLIDPADVKTAATTLRTRLEQDTSGFATDDLTRAYAVVAGRLNDPADLKAEASALRKRLEQEKDGFKVGSLAPAYAVVAARLNDPVDVKAAVTALRARLVQEKDGLNAIKLVQAYAVVAARLKDPADMKAEASALRRRLEQEKDGFKVGSFAPAYAAVAGRLSDPADVKTAASVLRTLLEREEVGFLGSSLAESYASVAARLNDTADVKAAAITLRRHLEQETSGFLPANFARAYTAVVRRLTDPTDLKAEATALRTHLVKATFGLVPRSLASAYVAVAGRLNDPTDLKTEATALRVRLEQEKDGSIASSLAQAYAAVAGRLNDPADVKAEATALRTRLEQEKDGFLASSLAQAYAAVAGRLIDPAEVKIAATALRSRLQQEKNESAVSNLVWGYGRITTILLARTDDQARSALVREILLIAGQPYIDDPQPLLAALRPSAGKSFGDDTGAAVVWAMQSQGIRPDELRPAPSRR